MNRITYKTASGQQAKALAKQALSERLFVPGWSLRLQLLDIVRSPYSFFTIVLAIDSELGKPIGVLVLEQDQASCFVRVSHRRHGIGSRLLREGTRHHATSRLVAGEGVHGSVEFWNQNHVEVAW